jgi:Tol biopolymer transport system component
MALSVVPRARRRSWYARRRVVLGGIAVAFCAGTFLPGSGVASATHLGKNGLIAFTSVRAAGAFELYTMKPDGTGQRRLTRGRPAGGYPASSPEGSRIAFVNTESNELWLMRADGGNARPITRDLGVRDTPTWSPDGKRLAFVVWSRGKEEIWVMNLRTRRAHRLTRGHNTRPAWSPDGRRIAFTRPKSPERGLHNNDIYTIAPEGGRPRQLTRTPKVDESNPSWSRDGRLAFAAGRGDHLDLVVMNANGSRRHVIVTPNAREYHVDWSPDGTKLAFTDFERPARIFTVNVDGTGERAFGVGPYSPEHIDWTPDGLRIVFSYDRAIRSLALRDGDVRVVTRSRTDSSPAWSPNGHRLAFRRDGVIHVLRLRDRALVRLGKGDNPSWSPDGRRLAVQNGEVGGVLIVRADGAGGVRRLLWDDGAADTSKGEPAWSPDGRRLAFVDYVDTVPGYVCVLRIATPRRRRCLAMGTAPAWSPDGRSLAYECGRGVCIVRVDGTRKQTLARRGGRPRFSPDGRLIVYHVATGEASSVAPGRTSDVYVMSANGSGKRRLTTSEGHDFAPDWQPVRR